MSKRDYQNDFPSVTQVLGVLRKIGLENWFKYNTAQFCDEKSKRGKEVGTQTHEVIENYILGKPTDIVTEYGDEVVNALHSFMLFRKENPEMVFQFTEILLTSIEYQFNGTIDVDMKRGDTPLIGDWKTGECKKKDKPVIYDEMRYQVSAYWKLYNEIKRISAGMYPIERAVIVCFAKDKVAYNLYEMGKEELNDCFYRAFVPALSIYNLQKEKKDYGKIAYSAG